MTYRQFCDWREFDRLEPLGGTRGDWQAAAICTAFANVTLASRGVKKRFKVSDFLIEFGEAKAVKKQSWQEMKMIGQMIAMALTDPKDRK